MTTSNEVVEIITIVVSVISMLFSLSVVVILVLHYRKLVSGKLLIHNVFIIAICDTLVSFSYSLGYHIKSQHDICALQGFITTNAERASWMWTDILIMNIYGVIVYQDYIIKNKVILHITIWTIITVLAFVPLADGVVYGTNSTTMPIRCGNSFSSSDTDTLQNAARHWGSLQNYMCLCSLVLIVVITTRIFIFIYYPSQHSDNVVNLQSDKIRYLKTVLLYPIAMFVCWFPSQFYYTCLAPPEGENTDRSFFIGNLLHVICPLYGLFLSLIYYTETDKARTLWTNIFIKLKLIRNSKEVELRESSQTIDSDIHICDVVENTLINRILE